jgi:hypothetical protein
MNVNHCLNCDSQVSQTQNFCANCGQPTKIHRFTLGHFFHEGFHAFTHADKGLFYLLKELAIRPGIVAREYISGKRKKYYNPFTFFLILAAFFVLSGSVQFSATKVRDLPVQISKIQNPKQKEQAIARFHRGVKAQEFFTKHGNIIAMIAVPFFAFYFWLIYYRRSYNYSEHLVANLMFISFANLAFSLIVFPLQAIFHGQSLIGSIKFLGFLLQWFYIVMAYRGFMQLKGFWPMLKIVFATLIGLMLWAMITVSAIAIYAYQNAHFYELFKYMNKH